MTQFIESYTGPLENDEFRLWLERLQRTVNENAVTGAGTGGSGPAPDVTRLEPQANGEVLNTVDNSVYGYLRRFLHFRFASDEDGSTQITNVPAFTGSTLYVGTFNSETTSVPSSANFVYRPIAWGANMHFTYRITGGGRIIAVPQGTVPSGFMELTAAGTVDLDALGDAGATGDAFLQLEVFIQSETRPAAPTGGAYNFDTDMFDPTTLTMGWSQDAPDASTTATYRSVAVLRATGSMGTVNVGMGWTEPRIAFLNGNDGDNGETPVAYYSENALDNRPASHPGIDPGPWSREDDAADNPTDDFNWIVWGFERGDPTSAEYNLTATGTAGQSSSTGGAVEEGNIVVDPNVMVSMMRSEPEVITVGISGNTGTFTPDTSATTGQLIPTNVGDRFTIRYDTSRFVYPFTIQTANPNFLSFAVRAPTNASSSIFFPATSPRPPQSTINNVNEVVDFMQTHLLNDISLGFEGGDFVFGEFRIDAISSPNANAIDVTLVRQNVGRRLEFNLGADNLNNMPFAFNSGGAGNMSTTATIAGSVPSQVRFQIPASNIDETISLEPSLTSVNDLAVDLVSKVAANTALNGIFTSRVVNNQAVFTTRTIGDIVAMITPIQNNGTIMLTVIAQDGAGSDLPVIQVNFDPIRDTPTETMITLSGGDGPVEVARSIAAAINNHEVYRGNVNMTNNRQIDFQKINEGVSEDITITVPTTGNSNITPASFTVNVTQQGQNPVIIGNPGTYNILINGATRYQGNLLGSTAAETIDIIREVINTDATFVATETNDTTLNIVAPVGFNSIEITTTPGSGDLVTDLTLVTAGTAGGFTPISSINQFQGTPGTDGAAGANGAGWYRYITALTQAQLDALNSAQIDVLYRANIKEAIVAFDRLILAGLNGAVRAVVRDSTNSVWNVQAQFIDGNLLVAGTVTAASIAADAVQSTNFNGTSGDINNPGTTGYSLNSNGTAIFNSNVHIGGDIVGPGSIRQGIVVDSESVAADSTQTGNTLTTVEAAERFTTKGHTSNLVVFGATAGLVEAVAAQANQAIRFAFEVSIDNGANWMRQSPLPVGYDTFRGAAFSGQLFNAATYLAITVDNVPANTEVRFRTVYIGTAPTSVFNGGWGWGASIIEEKNVT